jgi:hypothetical protein
MIRRRFLPSHQVPTREFVIATTFGSRLPRGGCSSQFGLMLRSMRPPFPENRLLTVSTSL